MRYLTIQQRESIRDALTRRAARLRNNIGHLLKAKQGSTSELFEDALRPGARIGLSGEDPCEAGNQTVQQDIRRLQIINEALAKLRSPEYGPCVDCEDQIPFFFLSEDPLETLCRKCAQRRHLAVFVPAEM